MDLFGTIREYGVVKPIMRQEIPKAHPGDSSYIHYDTQITKEALAFLEENREAEKPWCLYVGYTFPHLPFISPQETWNLYDEASLPMPFAYHRGERAEHESFRDIRDFLGLQEEYTGEEIRRAIHAYYGMCPFLDTQIGQLLGRLRDLGLDENTYVIYTSDHGEMMGNHGLWFKNCMLEDSSAIPLILSGLDIPRGTVNRTNISLVDIYPTVLDLMGVVPKNDGKDRQGISLYELCKSKEEKDRAVYSEFHTSASYTGGFMVRWRQYKYIDYVGYPPLLFDLDKDPLELHDHSTDPAYAGIGALLAEKLQACGGPREIDASCRADQAQRLERYGGKEYILHNFQPIIFSPPPQC